ncbi:hypothetical protein U1Q18_040241 [Sarracenia purpurea var. burkii]
MGATKTYASIWETEGASRVCVPIDPNHCEEFDPTTVPTLSKLLGELNMGGLRADDDDDECDRTSLGKSVRYFRSHFLQPLLKSCKETTELLLGQLQQLRAGEELKKSWKEEKAKLKAARMQNRLECVLSSGSSSESSDSGCEEVVDTSRLKAEEGLPPPPPPLVNKLLQPVMQVAALTLPSTLTREGNASEAKLRTVWCTLSQLEVEKTVEERCVKFGSKKIEVCMGGKCKKLGAVALLAEFQRVVGGAKGEEAVVGCKCKDGPNVKVTNGGCDDASVRTPTNRKSNIKESKEKEKKKAMCIPVYEFSTNSSSFISRRDCCVSFPSDD